MHVFEEEGTWRSGLRTCLPPVRPLSIPRLGVICGFDFVEVEVEVESTFLTVFGNLIGVLKPKCSLVFSA